MEDGADAEILRELRGLARGFDVYGNRIPPDRQMQAVNQIEALLQRQVQNKLARDTLNTSTEIAHRKLDIEQEKVQVQKAEVFVRALEVAAQAGLPSDQLMTILQGLGTKLLPGGTSIVPEARQIAAAKT